MGYADPHASGSVFSSGGGVVCDYMPIQALEPVQASLRAYGQPPIARDQSHGGDMIASPLIIPFIPTHLHREVRVP